ncbi:MAG: PEFG-CTERM sorting domain-containing protein [Nitrosopumilus sp.]
MFNVVPEFGTMVMMILIISIISSIVLSRHTIIKF